MELRLVVERCRENRLLYPDANSLICDLMFSCSRFLLVELLLFRYAFFRSSHQIAEAGVAGRHRDAEIVEAEKYERILGTSFILDGLLFVLDGIFGGTGKKRKKRMMAWRTCLLLFVMFALCWNKFGVSAVSLFHFFSAVFSFLFSL